MFDLIRSEGFSPAVEFNIQLPRFALSLLPESPSNPTRYIVSFIPNLVSFSLDVVFYVAIGLAVIQFYRGIVGKTITAQTSILKQA